MIYICLRGCEDEMCFRTFPDGGHPEECVWDSETDKFPIPIKTPPLPSFRPGLIGRVRVDGIMVCASSRTQFDINMSSLFSKMCTFSSGQGHEGEPMVCDGERSEPTLALPDGKVEKRPTTLLQRVSSKKSLWAQVSVL